LGQNQATRFSKHDTGKQTSASLAKKLMVSPRRVNRYVLQLKEAGWDIEQGGVPTHKDYYFELVAPKLTVPEVKRTARKKRTETVVILDRPMQP